MVNSNLKEGELDIHVSPKIQYPTSIENFQHVNCGVEHGAMKVILIHFLSSHSQVQLQCNSNFMTGLEVPGGDGLN